MIYLDYLRMIILIMPLGIFLTFGLLVLVVLFFKHAKLEQLFKRLLFFYCSAASISSFLLLTYYYDPVLFERLDLLYAVSAISAIVLFHHMLCYMIRFDEPFDKRHYVSVAFAGVVLLIGKWVLPSFWSVGNIPLLMILILFFGVLHAWISLARLYNHQLKLSLRHNIDVIDKSKAIPFIIEILLFPWVFAVCPLITGQDPDVFTSLILMGSILMALRMNIPLTYSMIRHYAIPYNRNSLLVNELKTPPATEANSRMSKRVYRKYNANHIRKGVLLEIDKKAFESYVRKHKPYLNPDLTLYDLAKLLQTNRTYLSKFINNVYKMNFNNYINRWRLHEMKRLLALSENKGKTAAQLFKQAGFASHRTYLRAKNLQMDKKAEEKTESVTTNENARK